MTPSSLYKYIPFCAPKIALDKKLQRRRIKCFENGEIWYPKASKLNDPYECSPDFILVADDIDLIVDSLTEEEFIFIKDRNGVSTKENLIRVLKTPNVIKLPVLSKQPTIPTDFIHRSLFFAIISALSSHYLSTIGVLSLTDNPFDLKMWAHYGGNSTGVCVEFQRNSENVLGSESTKSVSYLTERPQIKFHERHLRQEEIVTSKSKEWEYEQEWRHWRKNGDKPYPFPGKIVRVIFGLNCHPATIEIIKGIFDDAVGFEEIVLGKDYSMTTDCGLKHSLSKVNIDWS